MRKRAQQVTSVTSVRRALSEDIEARTRRYLFSMGVRIACFFAMLVVPGWPAKIAFAIGAAVIPAIAVLVANAGVERGEGRADPTGASYLPTKDVELHGSAHTLPPFDPNAEYLR